MKRDEMAGALGLFDARFAADVANANCPGFSAAVVHGAELVWARGFGLADIAANTPATADTVYAVGSITKLFTATMLMRLRDAGKLRLDDPVQSYVPDVAVPRWAPDAPEITFRHLVTHTAGLPKDAPLGYWATGTFPDAAAVIGSLAQVKPVYPPATRYKYSNLGVALLGHTLARIAGQPWESYISEQILGPLGMTASAPRLTAALAPKTATGYLRPTDGWPPNSVAHIDIGGIGFGGSLHASVVDMAKFIAEQFTPTPRLLSASTRAEMQRVHWLNPDWQSGRGIAWEIQRSELGVRINHGGGVYGFTTRILLSPVDGLGVAVFTNGSDGEVGRQATEFMLDTLIPLARRAASRQRATPIAAPPAEWRRYVGQYAWLLGDAEIFTLGSDLFVRFGRGATAEMVQLTPQADGAFGMAGGQVHGEPLRFEVSPDGSVDRFWAGPHPYDRVRGQ